MQDDEALPRIELLGVHHTRRPLAEQLLRLLVREERGTDGQPPPILTTQTHDDGPAAQKRRRLLIATTQTQDDGPAAQKRYRLQEGRE